jgi:hypothetical protein
MSTHYGASTLFDYQEVILILAGAGNGEASRMRQNYLGRVHYIDAAFGRFVAQLEARGMYENSVIAMSAGVLSFENTTGRPISLDLFSRQARDKHEKC